MYIANNLTLSYYSYYFTMSSVDNRQAVDEIAKELVMAERAKGNKLSMTDTVGKLTYLITFFLLQKMFMKIVYIEPLLVHMHSLQFLVLRASCCKLFVQK